MGDIKMSEQKEVDSTELGKDLYDSVLVAHEFMSELAPAFQTLIDECNVDTNDKLEEQLKTIRNDLLPYLTLTKEYQAKLVRYSNVGNMFLEVVKSYEKLNLYLESVMVRRGISLETT